MITYFQYCDSTRPLFIARHNVIVDNQIIRLTVVVWLTTNVLMLKILRFRDAWTKCHLTRSYTQKVNIGVIGADLQKKIDKMPRIRPSNQPPKVWKLIEKIDKNGKPMKFTIQEIPEDRYEDAVQHMCEYFLADEPTCQCLSKSPIVR